MKPRGGARKGAGRPRKDGKLVTASVVVKPETMAILREAGVHPGRALDRMAKRRAK